MKQWIIFCLMIGGIVASGKANSEEITLAPALSRPGETVPIHIVVSNPPYPNSTASNLGMSLAYPEGITPLPVEVSVPTLPREERKPIINTHVEPPPQRRINLAVVSSVDFPVLGFTVVLPFRVNAAARAGVRQFDLISADLQDVFGLVFEAEPSTGTLLVTGPGGKGDVDGDGSISVADAHWALRLLHFATGSPGVLASADVWPANGDGQLSLQDVRSILRLALGLPPAP